MKVSTNTAFPKRARKVDIMKKSLHRIAISLVLCTVLGPAALAGGKTKSVTFYENVKVGDTLVKKGTYFVTFDEKSNELTIRKNGKVIASTPARLGERASTSNSSSVYATKKDKESNVRLSRVSIDGKHAIIGDNVTAATDQQ